MAKIKKIKTDNTPILITEEDTLSAESKASDPKAKQKKAIIAFVSMCLIAIISYIVVYLLPEVSTVTDHVAEKDEIIGQYGSTQSYIFYPVDDELDISTVKEYQELSRLLKYKSGPETFAVTDETLKEFGKDVQFFDKYFKLIIAGDYTAYSKLFTDKYYEDNPEYKDFEFTQQMLYDMEIEYLGKYTANGVNILKYDVSYRIFRNNGTFRNDIDSDVSKTLYFELVETDDGYLIDFIDYYVK